MLLHIDHFNQQTQESTSGQICGHGGRGFTSWFVAGDLLAPVDQPRPSDGHSLWNNVIVSTFQGQNTGSINQEQLPVKGRTPRRSLMERLRLTFELKASLKAAFACLHALLR